MTPQFETITFGSFENELSITSKDNVDEEIEFGGDMITSGHCVVLVVPAGFSHAV